MANGLRTSFCTPFLYLPSTFSYAVLNEAWKRSMRDIFTSLPFSSCGFKKMAQRAGDNVKAFKAEMKIDTAIVTPNSL